MASVEELGRRQLASGATPYKLLQASIGMKKFVAFLLIAELFIAFFVLTPTCSRSSKRDRAWFKWYKNPTPETKAEFDKQNRIARLEDLGFSTVVFGLMAGPTLIGAHIWRRRHEAQADLPDSSHSLLRHSGDVSDDGDALEIGNRGSRHTLQQIQEKG